jgi:exodeoxyribonuclease VII small subunit
MANKKMSYKVAYEKLENIHDELSEGNIEIDELENKLKESLEYMKICKEIIKKQEAKVTDILKEIEKEEKL